MRNARKVMEFDVAAALEQVRVNEELWGQITLRQTAAGTPFTGTDDIWLRYGADPATFNAPHLPVFYKAWHTLTELQPMVWSLVRLMTPVNLGGILVTRIPAGGSVAPHCDKGYWHADYNETKFYVILEGNGKCLNTFEDEICVMAPGECWQFNNLVEHAVYNLGTTPRVALIVTMRVER